MNSSHVEIEPSITKAASATDCVTCAVVAFDISKVVWWTSAFSITLNTVQYMITQYNNSKFVPLDPHKLSNLSLAAITSTGLIRTNLRVIDIPKADAIEIGEARQIAITNGRYGTITLIEPGGFVLQDHNKIVCTLNPCSLMIQILNPKLIRILTTNIHSLKFGLDEAVTENASRLLMVGMQCPHHCQAHLAMQNLKSLSCSILRSTTPILAPILKTL